MSREVLFTHLESGSTHVCQCWAITRADGVTFGFTDHDRSLSFEGITFLADSGMTAKALALTTGLSVDNSEAIGLLQSDVIAEEDIVAGRYDGAEIVNWLVQWDQVGARQVRFRGRIGEITRQSGQFQVELRGLSDLLNQPVGRSFLRSCSAVLGDQSCGFDTTDPAYSIRGPILVEKEQRVFVVDAPGFNDRWFEQGYFEVNTGAAKGLKLAIKLDRANGNQHRITLWDAVRADIAVGDEVRLVAGCDKRAETCRVKFANLINFQGFPDMPGEDWLMAVPRSDNASDGGSLVR